MTYFDKTLKSFLLNGALVHFQDVLKGRIDLSGKSEFETETLSFIKKWLVGQEIFLMKTSGSTGKPKNLVFRREALQKSALRTIETFKLSPGQTLLASLNPNFVAGMMMLVRAIEGNLNLIAEPPDANPLAKIEDDQYIDFCALTPNQVETALNKSPSKFEYLNTLLIGGAAINPDLEGALQNVQTKIYHSYSMTETLTHVALRKVNGALKSDIYHAIPGITFSQDLRGCLIVHDTILDIDALITNDIVDLVDKSSFRWIGRIDNVVNTGGIKIHIEEVEKEIHRILGDLDINCSFCLLSTPDRKLTNKLVLLIEEMDEKIDSKYLLAELKRKLPKYHEPKALIQIPELILTKSGKIDRKSNATQYLNP